MALVSSDILGLRLDEQRLFSDQDNTYSEKLKIRRLKLLERNSKFLKRFVHQEEPIVMICRAYAPMTFGEFYFSGSFVYFQKRCILIFTDQRILQISLNLFGKARDTIIEINYGDIEMIKRGGLLNPTFTLRYKNGKQESYNYLNANDMKKILAIVPAYLGRSPTPMQYRYNLCLRCAKALEPSKYLCPHCRLEYRNPQQMLRYALIFPGGGLFYTGQYLFAVQYLMAEGIMLALLVFSLIESLRTNQLWGGVFGTLVALIFIKVVHIFHGQRRIKEYIPGQSVTRKQ